MYVIVLGIILAFVLDRLFIDRMTGMYWEYTEEKEIQKIKQQEMKKNNEIK
jgi:hypothetical protein